MTVSITGVAPRFPGGGLRRRILGAFLALSLLPLFGSNAIGYLRSRVIVEGLVVRYLAGMADIQASHVQDRLDQRMLLLEALASGNRFLQAAVERGGATDAPAMAAAAAPAAVSAYLRSKVGSSGAFETLALYRSDGGFVAASHDGPLVAGALPAAREPITLIREPDPATPPTLRFVAALENDRSESVGFLAATVHLSPGTGFLEIPPHIAESVESLILDAEGRPVFVSHLHGHVEYDHPLESPLVGTAPGGTARYRDREGVDVFGASAALPHFGWMFVTEVPAVDALQALGELRSLSLVLGGAFAILVMSLGWFMAGGIVAPVRRLVLAARRLGAGDLSIRVPEPGRDEVGELSEAFNEMAQAMASDRERIDALHGQEIQRAGQLATVGELASGLAHEIKNPLVGVSNGLDLVLRRVDDPELEPITTEMRRQLGRIETAVRDLLSFARPPQPEIAPVSLNEIVRRATVLLEPAAGKGGIRLKITLAEGVPLVSADSELLHQALVNLIINAVQASPEGGVVEVRTTACETEAEVSVQDQGRGMEPGELGAVFRPFYTTRHSGTGLGLSITRGIVERHGGTVEVRSTPGEGSVFTIRLPVLDSGEEET